ncbi:hypothetical protein [Notoacmeibacter sp. MSK16QG-6]|uniref:hypothetical protein n=1 Tax=Notoacmeibacter sp. MSK16QG-6 TaxID=2957982 RepID=UPI0020A04670|nr:hypothetical protein [Notoacmeibacter sp. MSK16QG-6]MCP1198597.1 hypothetical protein [Notoacmeibacter sp. MSK16QG-6]
MRNLLMTGSGIVVVAGLLATGTVAWSAPDRYVMDRTEDGWVRMDSQTGEITVCRQAKGKLSCATDRPDDQIANGSQTRIDRLEKRVAALERQLKKRDDEKEALPSEAEFDQALGYMRRFFDAFRDMVREFQAEEKTGEAL